MASTIMHIAIAENIYRKINNNKNEINYYDFILGSIAPDISKQVGDDKKISHFIYDDSSNPDLISFLNKYRDSLTNSFMLGYYVHLFSDRLFYSEFLPLFVRDDIINSYVKCLDGNTLNMSKDERKSLLYNDYTNLNISLIDEYGLNLEIFYDDYKMPICDIEEIDLSKLPVLIDNIGIIIENATNDKNYIIDISKVKSFIDSCSDEIYNNLISLNVIKQG